MSYYELSCYDRLHLLIIARWVHQKTKNREMISYFRSISFTIILEYNSMLFKLNR